MMLQDKLCASCVDFPAAGTRILFRAFKRGRLSYPLGARCMSLVDRGHKPSSGYASVFRF